MLRLALADLLRRAQPSSVCVGGIRMSTIATSGLCIADLRQQILGGARLADDLEARVLEQARDPLAQQHGVVGENDAQAAKPLPRSAEWWKSRGQAGDVELEEPFWPVEPGQFVFAQVGELVRCVECILRPLGEQDLAAAPGLGDARRAVNVQAVIVAVAHGRFPGVEAHADTQLDALRPGMSGDCALRLRDCLDCPAGVLEDDEELVATMVDDEPCAALHDLAEEAAVIREHRCVPVAEQAHELC